MPQSCIKRSVITMHEDDEPRLALIDQVKPEYPRHSPNKTCIVSLWLLILFTSSATLVHCHTET